MNKEHYRYIDVLKGFGIILVVLGHLNPNIYLEKWIYSFHMFLFFFLSGYVFKKKSDFWEQLRKSANSLLLPYIFWNGVAIIFSLIIKEYTLFVGIKKIFYFDLVSWNSPVWFLVVLFWTRLAYQLLSNKKIVLIPTLFFMVACSYFGIFDILPMGLNILPDAIIYFGIGKLLSEIKIEKWHYALIAPMMVVSIVGSQINDRISMYGNYFGNYIISLLVGICAITWIFLTAKLLAKPGKVCNILSKTGKYSINVMCTHYLILRIMQFLSVHILNGYDVWKAEGFLKAIIVTAVVFAIEYLIVKSLRLLRIPNSHILRV